MLNLALCSDNVTQLEHLAGLLAAYGEAHPEPALKVRRFRRAAPFPSAFWTTATSPGWGT